MSKLFSFFWKPLCIFALVTTALVARGLVESSLTLLDAIKMEVSNVDKPGFLSSFVKSDKLNVVRICKWNIVAAGSNRADYLYFFASKTWKK